MTEKNQVSSGPSSSSNPEASDPQNPLVTLTPIELQPSEQGPAIGDPRLPIDRRFLIDASQLQYNIPAEIKIRVEVQDPRSNRPVNLSIQELSPRIFAIEVDPLLVRIVKIEKAVDNLQNQFAHLWNVLGNIELDENKNPKQTILKILHDLPKITAREAGQEIVGESFFRFDSTSRYYPTLIFHFKEKEIKSLGKRTQVKVRWTEFPMGKLFDHEDTVELKRKMNHFYRGGLEYLSGPLRLNFVSATSVRWKTTIYAGSEFEGKQLLKTIVSSIGEPFDDRQISITTGRKLTPTVNVSEALQRKTGVEWERICKMELNKIMLQINGADEMIEVFRKEEL